MLKRKKIVFSLLLFLLSLVVSCNNGNESPSAENENLNPQDSIIIASYLDSLKNFTTTNQDSLKQFSDKILALYPQKKAVISVKIAHTYYVKTKLYLTKHYFEIAATSYLKADNTEMYAEQLTNIGVINELMGNYPMAIDNYFESLAIFKKLGLDLKVSSVHNNLGVVYQQLEYKDKAIEYYKNSLAISDSLKRFDLSASRLNNIASVFESFDNNLDSAFYYYNKAFLILKKDSNTVALPTVEANIANIYIQQNKLLKADSILNHAQQFCETHNNQIALNSIYGFRATLFLKQNNFKDAEFYAQKVVALSKEQSYKEHELKGTRILIDCYEKQGDFDKAFATLKIYNSLKDEIIGADQQKEINRLTVKYNVAEKDNQIEILKLQKEIVNKRNNIFYSIVAFIILILIIFVYIFYLQKKHANLKIKSMQYDLADYIKQLTVFEDEINEIELSQHELFLQKVKQFELTDREEEVLLYISNGYKNTEIAEKMFVSINTIKSHIKNIFVKLDVRNRIEATNKTK